MLITQQDIDYIGKILHHKSKSVQDREDMTFICCEKLLNYHNINNRLAYINRTIQSVVINYYRGVMKNSFVDAPFAELSYEPEYENYDNLYNVIDQLSPKQREAIKYILADVTQKEVQKLTGENYNTIKANKIAALKNLKNKLTNLY